MSGIDSRAMSDDKTPDTQAPDTQTPDQHKPEQQIMGETPHGPELRDYVAIFLVSATIMVYQIALTRVLSVVVWYHFAFLAISLVMFGLGLPGVWFALSKRPLSYLPGLLLASGIAVPASIALIVGTTSGVSVPQIVLYVLPATLSLGAVVCLILIKATGPAIAKIYGVDLVGAGLGAMVVIPLMHVVPTPQLAAGTGFLPLIALLLYRGTLARVAAVVLVISAGLVIQGGLFKVTRSKTYDESELKPLYEKWSPTARLTVFDERFFFLESHESGFSWGRGDEFPEDKQVTQYWLEQDGNAGTPITEFSGDLDSVEYLLYDVTTAAYQVRQPQTVAIIGAGGGRDILTALVSGATDIDAVEINGHTITAVSDRFGGFSGEIYRQPGVNAVVNEGRSHLTYSDKRYDIIQISLIDSWAASAAGAFALAENNLYTIEAFDLYLDRLTEDGILSTSRWSVEMPRLIVLGKEALESFGIDEPGRHMVVVRADRVSSLLISRSPFTEADLAKLDEACETRGFRRIYPVPGELGNSAMLDSYIDNLTKRLNDLGLYVDPPTDDKPYFFHVLSPFSGRKLESVLGGGLPVNLNSTMVLRQAMIWISIMALVMFMLPFVLGRLGSGERDPLRHLVRASLFFAAIGGGFMLFENLLVQRFVLYLGHPSYATTVILATLLIGMGVGSTYAESFGLDRLRRLGLSVPLVLLVLAVAMPSLFDATLGLPLAVRILISCALLVPTGAMLGLFFPLGMLRFGDNSKPWFWAINGVFGVVASVMSLALSMELGYSAVGVVAAAVYLVAWACLRGKLASG